MNILCLCLSWHERLIGNDVCVKFKSTYFTKFKKKTQSILKTHDFINMEVCFQ